MKKLIALLLAIATVLSMTACTGSEAPTEPAEIKDLQALYGEVSASMPEMVVLDAAMMLNYCGINADDCTQVIIATCADGLRTDEIWLIEAASPEVLSRIQILADMRLTVKGEESISYSPEQYAVVEKARIITNGLYFALVVSPDVDSLAASVRNVIG